MFSNLDSVFRESIKDDYLIFDNKINLTLMHNQGDATPNFETGRSEQTVELIPLPNCIYRQASMRDGPAVPQLHQRDMSVQKDQFSTCDCVIEVPAFEGLTISQNDRIVNPETLEEWRVSIIDYSTLKTRYRVGCMVFGKSNAIPVPIT